MAVLGLSALMLLDLGDDHSSERPPPQTPTLTQAPLPPRKLPQLPLCCKACPRFCAPHPAHFFPCQSPLHSNAFCTASSQKAPYPPTVPSTMLCSSSHQLSSFDATPSGLLHRWFQESLKPSALCTHHSTQPLRNTNELSFHPCLPLDILVSLLPLTAQLGFLHRSCCFDCHFFHRYSWSSYNVPGLGTNRERVLSPWSLHLRGEVSSREDMKVCPVDLSIQVNAVIEIGKGCCKSQCPGVTLMRR